MESRFGAHQIHNVDNLIKVDVPTHNQISGHYKSNVIIGGETMRVRDWMDTLSFDEQYEYGVKVLRRYGVVE